MTDCKHEKHTVTTSGSREVARWCETCGAIQWWSTGVWRHCLAEYAAPVDRKELGDMLGRVLRGAFPDAAEKVEKFIAEATEGSETIQWKPASAHPGHLDVVLFLLGTAPDGERVHVGFRMNSGNWCAFDEEGDPEYPPDAATHYAEMPKGPIEP